MSDPDPRGQPSDGHDQAGGSPGGGSGPAAPPEVSAQGTLPAGGTGATASHVEPQPEPASRSDVQSVVDAGHATPAHDMHDGGHGHDDDHGAGHEHGGEALGPIDIAAWGAGIVGLLLGAVMAVAIAMSTGYITL